MAVSDRIARILGAFENRSGALSLTEIADAAGVPLSTTHRLVSELAAAGLLERDEERRYAVSLRLYAIGSRAPQVHTLPAQAQRELRALAAQVDRPVFLSVPNGSRFVVVDALNAPADDAGIREGDLVRFEPSGEASGLSVTAVPSGSRLLVSAPAGAAGQRAMVTVVAHAGDDIPHLARFVMWTARRMTPPRTVRVRRAG